jgi:hypothetical protein
LKSQPEPKVRRLAVFGGYGSTQPDPAYARVTPRHPPEDEVPTARVVIQLAAARPADLQRAAA